MKKTSIFATVTALAALVIYLVTSLTGFMAGKAMNIWPVVLTVAAIVLLFAADKMKKPSALKDIVIVLTGFALIGCISFFAMDRVKLAADVWFIPVNPPRNGGCGAVLLAGWRGAVPDFLRDRDGQGVLVQGIIPSFRNAG